MIGAIVWTLGKLGFKGLPGDIKYESGDVRIYVPIVTMLVISVVASILIWVVRMIMHK